MSRALRARKEVNYAEPKPLTIKNIRELKSRILGSKEKPEDQETGKENIPEGPENGNNAESGQAQHRKKSSPKNNSEVASKKKARAASSNGPGKVTDKHAAGGRKRRAKSCDGPKKVGNRGGREAKERNARGKRKTINVTSDSFLAMECTPVGRPKKRSHHAGGAYQKPKQKQTNGSSKEDVIMIGGKTLPLSPTSSIPEKEGRPKSNGDRAGNHGQPLEIETQQQHQSKLPDGEMSKGEEKYTLLWEKPKSAAEEAKITDKASSPKKDMPLSSSASAVGKASNSKRASAKKAGPPNPAKAPPSVGSAESCAPATAEACSPDPRPGSPLPRVPPAEGSPAAAPTAAAAAAASPPPMRVPPAAGSPVVVAAAAAAALAAGRAEADRATSGALAAAAAAAAERQRRADAGEPRFSYKEIATLESPEYKPDDDSTMDTPTREVLSQLEAAAASVEGLVSSLRSSQQEASAAAASPAGAEEEGEGGGGVPAVSEAGFWKARYEELAEIRETEAERAYSELLEKFSEREKALTEIASFYQSQFQSANLLGALRSGGGGGAAPTTPAGAAAAAAGPGLTGGRTPATAQQRGRGSGAGAAAAAAARPAAGAAGGSVRLEDNTAAVEEEGELAALRRKVERQRRQLLLYQALTSTCVRFPGAGRAADAAEVEGDGEQAEEGFGAAAVCTAINHLQEKVVQFKLSFDEDGALDGAGLETDNADNVRFQPLANIDLLPRFLQEEVKFSASHLPLFFLQMAKGLYAMHAIPPFSPVAASQCPALPTVVVENNNEQEDSTGTTR